MTDKDILPFDLESALIYDDDDLVIVNKPAGLLTIRDGYNASLPYLLKSLEGHFGQLWVVHRLDKETSGIVVFARNSQSHRALNQQFENRQVKKIYHALVNGSPQWNEKTIALPLRVNGDRRHRTIVDPTHGKPARTELRVLKRWEGISLIEAIPLTGYTHQIRAHLFAEGCPILADPLYQTRDRTSHPHSSCIRRLALHALTILFQHPTKNISVSFEAPYPPDFRLTLQTLDQEKQDRG
jgi:RluA family pseudouridine synthase